MAAKSGSRTEGQHPWPRLTGQRARSTLPACDTPGVAAARHSDGLSRAAAEAAWRVGHALDRRHAARPGLARRRPHLSRRGTPGRSLLSPPGQPCTVPVYDPGPATGRMLALDLDPGPHQAPPTLTIVLSSTVMNVAPIRPPRWPLRPRRAGRARGPVRRPGPRRRVTLRRPPRLRPVRRGAALARAARPRPGDRPPVPRRRPGADVVPRRPDQPSRAPGTSPAAGGCSQRRWRTPGRPRSTRTGRRCGRRCWPSSQPSCRSARARSAAAPDRQCRWLTPSWTTPACPWIPRLGGRAPLGAGLDQAARTGRWDRSRYPGRSARRGWPSWPRRRLAAGSWPTSGPRSAPEPGGASRGCMSGAQSRAGLTGSCPTNGEKRSASSGGEKNVRRLAH